MSKRKDTKAELTTPPSSDDEGLAPTTTPVRLENMSSLSLGEANDPKMTPERSPKKGKKRAALQESESDEETPAKKRAKKEIKPWTQEEGEWPDKDFRLTEGS